MAAALDAAFEISKLLDCGLDRETLSICVALLENGVNPEVGAEGSRQALAVRTAVHEAPAADQSNHPKVLLLLVLYAAGSGRGGAAPAQARS